MEKKTMDTLRTMICGELDDIAKKGTLSHETLDILKDLLESAKNLEKIDKYQKEKEEGEMVGYSQRKYYIDADYQPGMNSYARGMDRRMVYDVDSGNSYTYYGPMHEPMYSMAMGNQGGQGGNSNMRGYSRHGDTQEMKKELNEMMNETQDVKVKEAIQKILTEMNK